MSCSTSLHNQRHNVELLVVGKGTLAGALLCMTTSLKTSMTATNIDDAVLRCDDKML